ncbi:MAG: hypothetical protein ACHBN1_22290 [Heteroscytonema crispum UTEX LB 1556]
MILKQQLAVATVSFVLSFLVAGVPSIASAASWDNSLIYDFVHNKTVGRSPRYQLTFWDGEIEQNKSILCSIPEPSLLEDWINLFARLLIIGSFGYLGVTRYSSDVERYLQVVSRDFLIIVVKIFLLLTVVAMGIIFVSMFLSPHSTPSPIHPDFNCTLDNF